jgi:hypothetical protein
LYVRSGLGKWYESLLHVAGEAGAAVAETYGGQAAGAAVRGLHKGWTDVAFNRGKKGSAPQPRQAPAAPTPAPAPAYYPPPPPQQVPMAQARMFGRDGLSPTTLLIGAAVVVGGLAVLMRSRKR